MRKLLITLFVLSLLAGPASAESYMGMFNSATSHDNSGDSRVTVVPFEPYTIYLVVNADWSVGLTSWQIKMVQHDAPDYFQSVTLVDPGALQIGTVFDYNGWAVTNPNSCWHGWNLVATIEMLYADGGAHEITIEPYNLTQVPVYLSCAGEELPLSIIGPFGVNMDIIPTSESSWGAVKSLYR